MQDAYTAAFASLPAAARTAARQAAFDAFARMGLPGTDIEEWKYTDLSPLLKLAPGELGLAGPFAGSSPAPGAFRDGLDALNAAFCSGGADLAVDRAPAAPIVLDASGHQRHRLKLASGVAASVVLDTGKAGPLQTVFTDIEVGANAQLTLLRLNDPQADAHVITRTTVRLARDARLRAVSIDLGGRLCRHDLDVSLEAAGAVAHVAGLYLLNGDSFVDNHTCIEHRAPHGTSRERFRGIVADHARAVFNGRIVVHAGAAKTDSEQQIANLLLSPHAQVNAKPELQIDNDDVRCAHGATCGQLDDDAIYYLRSRGLPLAVARAVLLYTFADEVLREITDDGLRRQVERRVRTRLPDAGGQP